MCFVFIPFQYRFAIEKNRKQIPQKIKESQKSLLFVFGELFLTGMTATKECTVRLVRCPVTQKQMKRKYGTKYELHTNKKKAPLTGCSPVMGCTLETPPAHDEKSAQPKQEQSPIVQTDIHTPKTHERNRRESTETRFSAEFTDSDDDNPEKPNHLTKSDANVSSNK